MTAGVPSAVATGQARGSGESGTDRVPARPGTSHVSGGPGTGRRTGRRRVAPGAFGFVMATGIVSVAALLEGFHALSVALGAVATAAYGVLVVRTGLRLAGQGAEVRRELASPPLTFDFLTFPAASAVVGVRLAMRGWERAALTLGAVALVSWALLAPVALVAVRARDPAGRAISGPAGRGARGSWLLIVVATQSLPVLATALPATRSAGPALLVGVGLWLTGLGLYVAVLARIVRRVATGGLAPVDFTADFWIVLGALAISTLAGVHLAVAGRASPTLRPLEPWLAGGATAAWTLATAWIGPLVALQARRARHRPATQGRRAFRAPAAQARRARRAPGAQARRVPRAPGSGRFEVGWWSAVFPLGMYSAASHDLGVLLARPQLVLVGRDAFWVALAAWLAVAAAALHALVRARRPQYLNTGGCWGRPCGRRR